LRKAPAAVFAILIFLASGTLLLRGQDHTGTIQGTVVDKTGKPIIGAAVRLSSPAMLGYLTMMTDKGGGFDFSALAAGVYAVAVEVPGFETFIRDGITLRTGMSFFFPIKLQVSEVEQEIVVSEPATSLDMVSSKTSAIRGQASIRNLPLARNMSDILNTVPGVTSAGYAFQDNPSILGGTVRDNAYLLDGANLTDLFTAAPAINLNIDQLEEVEIITAGQPASERPAGGAFVNIISKSGGNVHAGELGLFLISDGLNKSLWTPTQIKNLGAGQPAGDKNLIEPSLSLGGPIMEDRAWYFLAGRYLRNSLTDNFVGPFVDARGREHSSSDWFRREMSGFFKLSVRPMSEARFMAWINWANVYQPIYELPSPRLPFISTHILDSETSLAIHGAMDYSLSPSVQVYVAAGYINRNIPKSLQADALGLPWTDDAGDAYGPLTGADYNSETQRQRIQVNASLRLFTGDFLGAPHTVSVGADFDDSTTNLNWWRDDNMLMYLDSRNPDSYYFYDRGLLGYYLCGTVTGTTLVYGRSRGLGAFVTDSFTLGGRLTFSLGLRFERSWGWLPLGSKILSGNSLSVFVGDAIVNPYLVSSYPDDFASDFNPWGTFTTPLLESFISWNILSPRIGLAYDVLGNARTVFKAAYARYPGDLSHRYFLPLSPIYPRSFDVYWFDANGDGQPDVEDEFSLPNVDLRTLSGSFSKNRVANDIKAPLTEEISFGIDQELSPDFTLGLHFVSRAQKNILDDVLFAPDTGEYWYAPGQAATSAYWVPFTTTVPGTGSYPNETVTIYTKSLEAPPAFLQLRNVPELERKYRALEFTFNKRMSRGWQLAGSLILSKAEGNIGGFVDQSAGLTEAGDSPNFFINRYGRLDTDRPLQIKLMGTVELPFGIWLSGYFHYQSGMPWQRWARILPPADWCAANNVEWTYYSVNLEKSGSRREKAWSSLDLRLEKKWSLGSFSRIGLYADVTNLLGFTASWVGLNDIDRWEPVAEGTGQPGVTFLQPDYGLTNAVFGKRTIRLGLRLDF